MIISVTLNPALYLDYTAGQVKLGAANPVEAARQRAVGRGLAVARLLHTFGHDVTAAGLAGGSSGEVVRTELSRAGVATRFTRIAAETRRVVRVADAMGTTTSFREPAPYITTEELGRLAADYREQLSGATAVVLCGSLPAGLPAETYGSLTSYAAEAGVPVILDAGGPELWSGAGRGPALAIPELASDGAALATAGPSSVVQITDRGARALTPLGEWQAELSAPVAGPVAARPEQTAELDLNGFRAGLVAGFVPGIALGWSWPDMLRHALALGAAASFDGSADLDAYESLLQEVAVEAEPPEPSGVFAP
jgi:tagatose 6-phosphate kinase